ncbi:hypothetical protein RA27_02080 [Ruegeria sp. ANG-R]|nr:hypothetical protein RA27_02080 [Ruegeria sp. ANG-R]
MLLCKLIRDDDGDCIPDDEQVWCLVTPYADGDQRFCTAEYFGDGEGNAVAKTKRVKRGGITCPQCISHIKLIKAVRL